MQLIELTLKILWFLKIAVFNDFKKYTNSVMYGYFSSNSHTVKTTFQLKSYSFQIILIYRKKM